jgi:hypothetical protein
MTRLEHGGSGQENSTYTTEYPQVEPAIATKTGSGQYLGCSENTRSRGKRIGSPNLGLLAFFLQSAANSSAPFMISINQSLNAYA